MNLLLSISLGSLTPLLFIIPLVIAIIVAMVYSDKKDYYQELIDYNQELIDAKMKLDKNKIKLEELKNLYKNN